MSELLAVLVGAAVGLGSALVPLLNAEVYAVATAGTHPALALAVVLALACGQTVGKLALFEAARRGSGRLRRGRTAPPGRWSAPTSSTSSTVRSGG